MVLEITGLEHHLCIKNMDSKNKKISKILDKYKSSFSSDDLSSLDALLSNDLGSEKYSLFTDGACEFDNEYKPINAGIGGVIKLKDQAIFSFSENVGVKTNNEAEYLALIKGLDLCLKNNISLVSIFVDSELVVKQINGDYKVKNDRMATLHKKTHEFLSKFNSWSISHVYRDKNAEADDLSKQGLSK
jgi:ribonuclease HI|tara:strand:+ start:368 stop:931 length:564 start_codon:yes stop_codon:yes gene_type:complete